MEVKFVNWKEGYRKYKEEISQAVLGCFERGDYIQRGEVKRFEQRLQDLIKVKHAIGVNSGTDALYLGLWAAGIKRGDEVITVSHTFIASIACINQIGATPVLIDVNREDYLMDVDKIEGAITEKTKAIIPVHYNGRMCDMPRIMEIARKHNLKVIEDSCQALGVSMDGRYAGTWGDAGAFSFYPSKLLGAAGDAGGLVTNDDKIAERVRLLQDHGRKTKTLTVALGMNSRLDEVQAAVLNVKMDHLEEAKERKLEVCARYNEELKGLPIEFPPGLSHENYVIRAKNRDRLYSFLEENGIETQIHEPQSNHKIPEVMVRTKQMELTNTEALENEVLSLPLNPEITDEEVDYIISKIKEFYA